MLDVRWWRRKMRRQQWLRRFMEPLENPDVGRVLVAAQNEAAAMVEEIHGTVGEPRNKTVELIIVASVSDGGGVVTMG